MLNNFNIVKHFFGPDDDEDEKFEIKKKSQYDIFPLLYRRIVNYKPKEASNYHKHNKKKKKGVDCLSYNSDNSSLRSNVAISTHLMFDSNPDTYPRKLSSELDLSKLEVCENTKFDVEYDYGNIEYKLKLCDLNNERIEELVTQMKFRLEEGGGECFYEIGVEDNGNALGISLEELEISVDALDIIGRKLDANAKIVKLHKGKVGFIAEVFIKKKEEVYKDKLEIKIGLLGDECSGKSTLVCN